MQPNSKLQIFFLREVKLVANSASPPIGKNIAYSTFRKLGASDAVVAAEVLTVNVEVPEPPVTEAGLSAQVGGRVAVGVTLQVRFTVPVKPLTGETVIAEVALAPAAIVAGVSAVPPTVKSGARVTVRPTVVL
jgi:hypothetical protein